MHGGPCPPTFDVNLVCGLCGSGEDRKKKGFDQGSTQGQCFNVSFLELRTWKRRRVANNCIGEALSLMGV